MSVTPSVPVTKQTSARIKPLAAIVYTDNVYPGGAFETLVARCRSLGLSLAGVLQHRVSSAPGRRCDLELEDLSSGHRTAIFEDRGAGAAGCRLDEAALAEVAARVEGGLGRAPDLHVLNKFGKAECSGGGLLDLIASAMDRKVRVVIGVPKSNLQEWRNFAGDFAVELHDDVAEIERWADGLR